MNWFNNPPAPVKPVLTPCIGICQLDAEGLCEGCHRSGAEIAAWSQMNDAARLRCMDEVLPQRAVLREKP